ncbi:LysR substrate-binding domain-containing protein [Obesumbacterium proteus]|uniref:LysR substrate-binding domain-containing protein n=1 Tax=Obesumbacterium proteus TaxID=82983 RepID=UPI002431B670|nr:LysR substrate-binding domain-containing protein [Obesumbacterium proteus]
MKNNLHVSHSIKSKNFDFNLLIIFETVFVHKSVTKTALILNVTPSAISQSLSKLRDYFSDPLFIREGNTLYSTTMAENIYERLKDGLNRVRQGVNSFSSDNVQSSFVIHASPYLGVRLLPAICAEIENHKFNFHISNTYTDTIVDNIEEILLHRKADIVFDIRPFYNFSINSEPLILDEVVAVCSKNHPRLTTTLTKEDISSNNSIYLGIKNKGILKIQSDINNHYSNRNFILSSNSIITNIAVIEKTTAVGFIPKWFFNKFSNTFNIKILECDFKMEPVTIYMAYNKHSLKSDNFISLLNIIKKQASNVALLHPLEIRVSPPTLSE